MKPREGRTPRFEWCLLYLLLASLIFTWSGCTGGGNPNGRLSGTITVSGVPAAGIKVAVFSLARAVNDKDGSLLVQGALLQEVSTANNGVYECSLSPGKYLVMPAGYTGTSRLVEIRPGQTSTADFPMAP